MLNQVICTGRMKAKPELKQTKESGKSVCSFTLAVQRDVTRGSGEQDVDWINAVAWGATAEQITRNFDKGKSITIIGRLTTRNWEDIKKQTRVATEVVVDRYYYSIKDPDTNRDRDNDEQTGSMPSRPKSNRTARFIEITADDGELPF